MHLENLILPTCAELYMWVVGVTTVFAERLMHFFGNKPTFSFSLFFLYVRIEQTKAFPTSAAFV